MADLTYWKKECITVSSLNYKLEEENESLKQANLKLRESTGAAIKQEPEEVSQLEEVVKAQNDEIGILKVALAEEKQYVNNLKATISSRDATLRAIKQSSSGAKGKLQTSLVEEQTKNEQLQEQLNKANLAKRRATDEVDLLKKQNPSAVLNIDWKIRKPTPTTTTPPRATGASIAIKEKRKWDNINASSDPLPDWKQKQKQKQKRGEDRDDDEDSLMHIDSMTSAQREVVAFKKEAYENGMPPAKRRGLEPTSQMPKLKLCPGNPPKTASKQVSKDLTIEESSDRAFQRPLLKHPNPVPSSKIGPPFKTKLGGGRNA